MSKKNKNSNQYNLIKINKENKKLENKVLNDSDKASSDKASSDKASNDSDKVLNDNNIILKELLNKQLKNINTQNKLNFNDIKRISKFLTTSIFTEDTCSLWNGYITNENNNLKGTYINFYYNKKKIALHRLLYENYIDKINEDDYIKFTCINKGKCCNINHLKKFSYNKNDVNINNNQNLDNNIKINLDKTNLTLEF